MTQLLAKVIGRRLDIRPFLFKPEPRVELIRVPIEKIRCQVKPFSETLGFSGKTINFFPPCKSYALYLSNREEAYTLFFAWYHYQWFDLKAWEIKKDEGGLRNGSLEKLVRNFHKEAGLDLEYSEDANHNLVNKAIEAKVNHYFSLFDSIRANGFDISLRPPIKALYMDGLYYLKGGHHRVSVLYNLGFEDVELKIVECHKPHGVSSSVK